MEMPSRQKNPARLSQVYRLKIFPSSSRLSGLDASLPQWVLIDSMKEAHCQAWKPGENV